MHVLSALSFLLLGTFASCSAPSGPWDVFNFAPTSRTVYPRSVYQFMGNVTGTSSLSPPSAHGGVTLGGEGCHVTFDFGFNVGGIISLNFHEAPPNSSVTLSFTESPLFINPLSSDDSVVTSANMSRDGVLDVPVVAGYWTQPAAQLRGGFRFLTITSTSKSSLSFSNVSCEITFMPHVDNLRKYSGYFYTFDPDYIDSDFLTKLWYAGAYTVQMGTLGPNTGRVPNFPTPGWANNASFNVAGPVLVDGAKRDRSIWPGDLGIALHTQFVSTNDIVTSRNALSSLFQMQTAVGALPYSGPPIDASAVSDTYHGWTLIGVYNYILYSGDYAWLKEIWSNYTRGVQFLTDKVDTSGLLDVTETEDWGRIGMGGHNSEANAIYYKILTSGAVLARLLNDTELAEAYSANASALKSTFNDVFWLVDEGMYRDNDTTTFCAQDGNSLAIVFNVTESADQISAISHGLTKNWGVYGAVAPELPDTIAPFIGGFEVQAHFIAGDDALAMDLLHREWGYMLYTPLSVQSTFLEGYTSNGSLYFRGNYGYDSDASFTSHAHGWSTGPTSALSYYVLGIQVTSPQGETWSIAPHTSGLPHAEGGYETPLGWFSVRWVSTESWFNITISTPQITSGLLQLPLNGTIMLDGAGVDTNQAGTLRLSGGNHTVSVQSSGVMD